MGGYVNGRVPVSVTTLNASVSVQTPYIQQGAGAHTLAVPDPAGDDTFVVLSGVQSLSSKTLLSPTLQSPLITTADIRMTGGTLTGGIINGTVIGNRMLKTQSAGATKTLDFSTADVFVVMLTQACTLTIANAASSKVYAIIVQQDVANSYTDMSWMTGFVNQAVNSGPSQHTGAVDFYFVTYDSVAGKHYGVGAKDVQG